MNKVAKKTVMAAMMFAAWVTIGLELLDSLRGTGFFHKKIKQHADQLLKWLEHRNEITHRDFGGGDEVQRGMNVVEKNCMLFLNIMHEIGPHQGGLEALQVHLQDLLEEVRQKMNEETTNLNSNGQEEQTASQGEPLRTA
jgi:hypothetical protein